MLRRTFIKNLGLVLPTVYLNNSFAQSGFYMPAEWAAHERCWMSWPHKSVIWGSDLNQVKQEVAAIAQSIAEFEPVTMLTTPKQVELASRLCGSSVEILPFSQDDNWMRDTGPVFTTNGQQIQAVSLNFNIWGNKFPLDYQDDTLMAEELAAYLGLPITFADVVAEGGAIEIDGEGTLITTESCLLNPNRNPDLSRIDVENALKAALGVSKVIWLPGNDVEYITDGHIDGMVRFVSPGVVIAEVSIDPYDPEYEVLQENVKQLKSTTDAKGRLLEVVTIQRPVNLDWDVLGDDFAASYANFYLANGGVVMPEFGDVEHDTAAKQTLADLFPERKVVQIDITHLAKGGGGIHCSTQQQPQL